MKIPAYIAALLLSSTLNAAEWSIELCSSLDLLAGRTGIADVRPSNDPHNNPQVVEENSGIYRGQWSWQSEMPALLYEIMHTGKADATTPSGFTALQAACVYADEALFNALLEGGAAVDPRPIDWQQLGYVGDTPLGLLVRFMDSRTAAARVRMARILLERGADPDATMTTWKRNRVASITPFCELGKEEYNHEMRKLLLQFGEQDLKKRMADWTLTPDWYTAELRAQLKKAGVMKSGGSKLAAASTPKADVGTIPLIDLVRKADVEGVRAALEAGASIEISARARRYGHEPLFNIPARRKDDPDAAVEIARLLYEAGADVNVLNRRGRSLRIHYDRFHSKASRALCAYFKECGSFIHPDSPDKREEVEQSKKDAQARAAAFAARLAGVEEPEQEGDDSVESTTETPAPAEQETPQPVVTEEPAPVAEPQPVVTEEPAPVAEPQPVVPEAPAPAAEPQPAVPEEPAPAPEPQPEVTEAPAPAAESQPEEPEEPAPVAEPQPEVPEEPAPAAESQPESAPQPTAAEKKEVSDQTQKLMLEVQKQLAELQAKYEAQQKAQDEAAASSQEPVEQAQE